MIKGRLNRHWKFTTSNSNMSVIQKILIAESHFSNSIQKKVKWYISYWDNSIRMIDYVYFCVFIFINIHQRWYSRKFSNPLCTTIRCFFFSRHFGNKFRSKSRVIANSNIYTPMSSKRVLHYVSNTHLHNIWTFHLVYNTAETNLDLWSCCRPVSRPFPFSEHTLHVCSIHVTSNC